MAYGNPPVPWSELERRLSDRVQGSTNRQGDGGDSPAWSRKRGPYDPVPEIERPAITRSGAASGYAELHCHSNFSFLDGASHPEELVEEAVRLGLDALAVTDHDGFSGVVRFAEAARAYDLPTVFGAEMTLGLPEVEAKDRSKPRGEPPPDPGGRHLLVLARDPIGYARLATAISEAQLRGAK